MSTLLFLTASLLVAQAPADEVKKFEGTWTAKSGEDSGQPLPDADLKDFKLVIAGEQMTATVGGRTTKLSYKLDPSKKPATIDITPAEGADKDKVHYGIYLLEGETLKICFSDPPSKDRPTEFATKAGSKAILFTFQKAK